MQEFWEKSFLYMTNKNTASSYSCCFQQIKSTGALSHHTYNKRPHPVPWMRFLKYYPFAPSFFAQKVLPYLLDFSFLSFANLFALANVSM